MLHLTKVAVGCPDVATLARLQQERWRDGAATLTRLMPKQAEVLIGGSLYWIIAHRLVARQAILGMAMVETPWGVKCRIELAPGPVLVVPCPCRAHQGWRYLAAEAASPDAAEAASPDAAEAAPPDAVATREAEPMPPAMLRELQALWLV